MKTILAPIDFSPVSRAVLGEATRLARIAKGRIVLLHVVQPVQLPFAATEFGALLENAQKYAVSAEKYARRHLSLLRAKMRRRGLRAEAVRAIGFPVTCIVDQAKKWAADYIVIGSHGHTGFYDLLVGSTSSGVLKRASCPVVVVPAPRGAPGRARK